MSQLQDEQLTAHFSLFQLTTTGHRDLLEENRRVTAEEKAKLTQVAKLLELCAATLGCNLDVHSASVSGGTSLRPRGALRLSLHLSCNLHLSCSLHLGCSLHLHLRNHLHR